MRIKFERYSDVKMSGTENPLTIHLSGPPQHLNTIKRKLTIKNKSVYWNVERLRASLRYAKDPHAKDKINKEIKKLQASEITELYEVVPDGLIVPAGFHWFASESDDSHLNYNLKEYYVEGLRDYQIEALQNLYKYKRSALCLFTGAGKSRIIASICKASELSGLRACVVVPNEYLVGQMVDTIKNYSDSVCGVGGGRKFKLGVNICVTTAQSAMNVIDNFDVIIIDESQHLAASTWTEICSSSKATHLYSLSGTPYRTDGQDMIIHAFSGPIVYEKNTRWGIENGWLKPCKIYLKTVDLVVDGKTKFLSDNTNKQKAYKMIATTVHLMESVKQELKKMLDAGRKVIVLYKTVEPGKALQRYCKGEIDFQVASSKFKKPIDNFRDGKTNILVSNSTLIAEGLDIPDADAIIMLTQNSSRIVTSQAVGRVLRKSDSQNALVIDITFNGFKGFLSSKEAREEIYREITDDVYAIKQKEK